MTLGLGNVRELLAALDNPQKRFRSVLVAGTNGKGSVSTYLSSIFKNSGMHVGLYSSPHVYSVTERIRIDSLPIALGDMEEAAARIVPLYDRIGYSYFEALTAIAFLVFAERQVDMAVLETGLGGRFDATNVVDPDVCVLTQIGLDHRRILGDTKEEILREKLGIARPGVPLLVGPLASNLMTRIDDRARNDNIPMVRFEELGKIELAELSFSGMHAHVQTNRRDYGSVSIPFLGEHQLSNALLAIGAAERIVGSIDGLDRASADVYVAGRFEVHNVADKRVILDVAHNDDALVATLRTLRALSPATDNVLVLGVLARKELLDFSRSLPESVAKIYLIQPEKDEWFSAPSLLDEIKIPNVRDSSLDVVLQRCFEDESDWRRFIDQVIVRGPHPVVLVTGSHQTVELFGRRLPHVGEQGNN